MAMSQKDKKLLIVAVVLFVIAGAAYWYFNRTPPKANSIPAPASNPTRATPGGG